MTGTGREQALEFTPTSVSLLLVSFVVLIAALSWRVVRSYQVQKRIAVALSDPDPDVRRAGVDLAVDGGLSQAAEKLLELTRIERDESVLAAMVHAIARRQWEPASTSRIVELRLWAKAYVDSHEELTRDFEQASRAATLKARRTHRSSDATVDELAAVLPAASNADPPRAVAEPADVPAQRPAAAPKFTGDRVLVTGAGGPAGVAVIRELSRLGHYVIAVDADRLAVGLRLADEAYVVRRGDDPTYLAYLWRAVDASRPDAMMCTVAEEYKVLVPAAEFLSGQGVATLFPSVEAVERCLDKALFAQAMADHGVAHPATGIGTATGVPGPWIVKPRWGRGSRDVRLATTKPELTAALREVPDPIVQTCLTGREFTADALVTPDGELAGAAARWRLETKAGISTKGVTFDDPAVIDATAKALSAVGLIGPANVQGFVAADGNVVVHEINPRFSGGLPLSLHAGADLVGEYLSAIHGRTIRRERLVARPGVTMLRHFAEVFEG